jgi:hypothetical protein
MEVRDREEQAAEWAAAQSTMMLERLAGLTELEDPRQAAIAIHFLNDCLQNTLRGSPRPNFLARRLPDEVQSALVSLADQIAADARSRAEIWVPVHLHDADRAWEMQQTYVALLEAFAIEVWATSALCAERQRFGKLTMGVIVGMALCAGGAMSAFVYFQKKRRADKDKDPPQT